MEPLTTEEKAFIGFCLFTGAIKLGPEQFFKVESIVDKLGIREQFEHYAQDFLKHKKNKDGKQ
jgi:hypothetical protein